MNTQITTSSREMQDDELFVSSAQDAGEDKLKLVLSSMRGRFGWAIVLALLLGGIGGYLGFTRGQTLYRSRVPIRVAPVLPRVLYNDEEKGILPRYESFVETQVALIQSQRVIDLAMQNPKWIQIDNDKTPEGVLKFKESLSVERSNELISVYFSSTDPNVAMVGAEAVVAAYKKLYLEADAESERRRLEILQQLQTAHNNELEGKKQLLASIIEGYNGQDIGKLYDAKFGELHRLQTRLSELKVQQSLLAVSAEEGSTDEAEIDIETLAALDPMLANLRQQASAAEHHLRKLEIQGIQVNHRLAQLARSEVDYLNEQIAERVQTLRAIPPQLLASKIPQALPADARVIALQAEKLREMIKQVEEEYRRLGRAHQQSQELREQIAEVRRKLDETRKRIDQLGVEATMSGRISVLSDAERPLQPYKDTRKKFAAFGAMGGMSLGFGSVLLLALADRRVRNIEELRLRLSLDQVLGVLPALPDDLSDPDQAAIAAHAVHHIRSMLQIRAGETKPTFAVTSPMSGTGKTSLVLALGSSFASSGARTLLIDLDLVGGGLTRRSGVSAHRKAGQLLCQEGILTPQQLNDVLIEAKRRECKLGEIVVERGLATQEQVDECLSQQLVMPMGVVEALAGEPLINCVAPSGIPNMWVLPLGEATAHHTASVSPASVQRLLTLARQHFQVVIVDTGPIPGSIEASMVAAAVDQVVMLLARGESRPLAQACLMQLRAIDAQLAGVVFNRVDAREMSLYTTSRGSSLNSMKLLPSLEVNSLLNRIDETSDYGPMARAVVATTPVNGKTVH